MGAHMIEHQIAENMLGIPECLGSKRSAYKHCYDSQFVWNFYMVTTLVGFTHMLLALGGVEKIGNFMLD